MRLSIDPIPSEKVRVAGGWERLQWGECFLFWLSWPAILAFLWAACLFSTYLCLPAAAYVINQYLGASYPSCWFPGGSEPI